MARMTDWQDTIVSELVVGGGGPITNSLLGTLTAADTRGLTLIRTLVRLDFASNTVAGAWGHNQIDMGIGVSAQEAFAAGVLPDPNISNEKPARGWVYRSSVGVAQNGVGAPVVYSVTADIRGARKVENGELYMVWLNTPIQGTSFGINARGLVRCLFKLP